MGTGTVPFSASAKKIPPNPPIFTVIFLNVSPLKAWQKKILDGGGKIYKAGVLGLAPLSILQYILLSHPSASLIFHTGGDHHKIYFDAKVDSLSTRVLLKYSLIYRISSDG